MTLYLLVLSAVCGDFHTVFELVDAMILIKLVAVFTLLKC